MNSRLTSLLRDGVLRLSHGCGLLSFGLFLVKLHQLGEVELGLLEDLDLSDHAVVLEWVDFAALSLDLFANFFFEATN